MNATERYKKSRADYERLVELHDGEDVEDFTGGFVFEEHAMRLMRNPTKATAAEIYERLIGYAAGAGFSCLQHRNKGSIKRSLEVIEIFSRYGHEISEYLEEY